MFIGHFGVGLGAKAAAPRVSLGTLFLASQFVDLLWPVLLLLSLEHVTIAPGITRLVPVDFVDYPISHSLLMACVWGFAFAFIYRLVRRSTRSAALLGLCVLSHWVLDLFVHRPDLPLYPGDAPLVGFGLWNSVTGTLFLEGAVFAAGLILYLRVTTARNRTGVYALWGLVAVLVGIHLSNLLGPPPPSTTAIAWVGILGWLLVIWAYWVDRNRMARAT